MPIFDQGYQHWQGQLSGHTWRWLTITRQGVRAQLRNRLPWIVLILAWIPALALAAVLVFWGLFEQQSSLITPLLAFVRNLPPEIQSGPRNFRVTIWTIAYQYFFQIEMFFAMILVLLVGPNLISQDLRFNAIPLYFSRPLRRFDYFVGKLGVIGVYLAAVAIVPALLAYVLGICFSFDLSVVKDTARLCAGSIAYGLVVMVSAGMLMLALSSLSRSSGYVGAFWVGIWFVSNAVARVLVGTVRQDWCSLLSYTQNLHRLGAILLDTQSAWQQIGSLMRARPGRRTEELLAGFAGPSYPWYWSAAVLLGLFGLSLWILDLPREIAGPAEMTPIVELRGVSKWYGNVIGLNNLTLRIPRGVTGLLGPNGAGKSTLLQLVTGQLRPSQGEVWVLGQPAWNNPTLNRFLGLCPEQDAFYEWMTGWEFVHTCARLSGLNRSEARTATLRALEAVRMTDNMGRAIRGYSKGMRQRTKLAQAFVHDPEVLFLDEPLSGTDPVARRELMDIITHLGQEGKSVVVSSHVLHEVQAMTPNIVLLNHGRLVAEGQVRQIRDLIDKYPHRIVLVCDHYRELAAKLVTFEDVEGLEILSQQKGILVKTRLPDAFYSRLPALSLEEGTAIQEVYSDDDNLEAVFQYLVNK